MQVVIFAGLALFSAPQTGPKLEISSHSIDLGELSRGETASAELRIESVGDAAIEVHRVGVQCKCAELTVEKNGIPVEVDARNQGRVDLVLEPAEIAVLRLHIDTDNWNVGETVNQLMIFHAAAGSPERVEFRFRVREDETLPEVGEKGASQPRLVVEPSAHEFGRLLVGESPEANFRLENRGGAELVLETVRGQCKCLEIEIVHENVALDAATVSDRSRNREVLRIAPGAHAELTVTVQTRELEATGSGEAFDKSVRIRSNDPRRPEWSVDLRANLVPALELVPVRARFDRVRRGETVTQEVVLRSEHLDGYRLERIGSSAPDLVSADFEEVERGERPVYRILVHFVGQRLGSVQEALELRLQHPTLKALVLPVYALVVPPVDFLSPSSPIPDRIDFGRLEAGQTGEQVVEVVNHDRKVPYVPHSIEVRAGFDAKLIDASIESLEEGVHYRVHVRVLPELEQRFFQFSLVIHSAHPELKERVIAARGFRAN